jgi:hypothetical protein
MFGEWYQKTNKTKDTNKLTLFLDSWIAAGRRQSNNAWQLFCDRFLKRPLLTVSRRVMNVANSVLWRMAIILKANKVNLFVFSVVFVFWYHSPDVLDTPHIYDISTLRVNSRQSQSPRGLKTRLDGNQNRHNSANRRVDGWTSEGEYQKSLVGFYRLLNVCYCRMFVFDVKFVKIGFSLTQ